MVLKHKTTKMKTKQGKKLRNALFIKVAFMTNTDFLNVHDNKKRTSKQTKKKKTGKQTNKIPHF